MYDNIRDLLAEFGAVNYELGYQDGKYNVDKKAMSVENLLDKREAIEIEVSKLLKTVRAICI